MRKSPRRWFLIVSPYVSWITLIVAAPLARADDRDLRIDLDAPIERPTCIIKMPTSWWIGTETGLMRVQLAPEDGETIRAVLEKTYLIGSVNCCAEFDGILWAGSASNDPEKKGLFRFGRAPAEPFLIEGKRLSAVRALHAGDDYLWVGSSNRLYRLTRGATFPDVIINNVNVFSLQQEGDTLRISTNYGLFVWKTKWDAAREPEWVDKQQRSVFSAHSAGSELWFASTETKRELMRWSRDAPPTSVVPFGETGKVNGFLKAGPTLWIATDRGLFHWRKGWEKPKRIDLPTGQVKTVSRSPVGGWIWVVAANGIFRIAGADNPEWSAGIERKSFDPPQPLTGYPVQVEWQIGTCRWRTTPQLVRCRLRVSDTETGQIWQFPKDGEWLSNGICKVSIEPLPAGKYSMQVEAEDLHGYIARDQIGDITIRPRYYWWIYVALAFIVPGTGLGGFMWVTLHSGRLRKFYEWRGARHALSGGNCKRRLEVSIQDGHFVITVVEGGTGTADVQRVEFAEGPGATWPLHLKKEQNQLSLPTGTDWQLEIREEDARIPLSFPWCEKAVAGRLVKGTDAVVVGQRRVPKPPQALGNVCPQCALVPVIPVPASESSQHPSPSGRPQYRLTLAALNHGLMAGDIVERVAKDAARLAVIPILVKPARARVKDLLAALQGADVVYVAAHALQEGIVLYHPDLPGEGEVFGPDRLAQLTFAARCRLLLLASCSVGAGGGMESLLYGLQTRGINVVASTIQLNASIGPEFMQDVVSAFLTERRDEKGWTLADCLRGAAQKRHTPMVQLVRENLDSIVLYGDPLLRVLRV